MNVSEMLERHERMMQELAEAASGKGMEMLAGAPDVAQARVDRLELRLKALHDERVREIERIDAAIASTETELNSMRAHVASDRDAFAPVETTMAAARKTQDAAPKAASKKR